MFYGNSGVSTNQSSPTAVWDNNYQGVWHFGSSGTLSLADSTSNAYTLTNNNTVTATTGEINGAASFNGSTNYLSNSSLSIAAGSPITISYWNYVTSGNVQSAAAFTIGASDNPNRIQANDPWSDSNVYWDYGSWSGGGRVSTSYSSYLGSWTYTVLEFDPLSTKHLIYLNGSLVASSTNSNAPTATQTGIDIGAWPTGVYQHGNIDEFRVSTTVRSADWTAAEYNSQSSPSTFYSVSPANAPNIIGLSPASGIVGATVTITGSFFGSTQGSSTVVFAGTTATPSSWSDTSITVPVPTGATSGNVVVTVSSTSSNGVWFTVPGSSSNGYSYSRAITISHAKVPNTDQSNFPVLIAGAFSYLATTSNGGNVTSSSGYDIIFTSDAAGTTTLSFEQESYNPITGAVKYWVKVPTVSHTTDTVIYVFYGNSGITTDQSNKTGVWDSNYKGVWHLPNGTTLTTADSTANGNNGTNHGATADVGQIDGAASVNSGNYIDVGSNLNVSGTTAFTLSAWIKQNGSFSGSYPLISGAENQQAAIGFFNTTTRPYVTFHYGGGYRDLDSGYTTSTGTWYYIVGTYDGTMEKIYVNGNLQATASVTDSITSGNTHPAVIGKNIDNGGSLNATIDEARISYTSRSTDWIAAEYNNQYSPSTFFSIASQANVGGPSIMGLSPTTGGSGTSVTVSGAGFGSSQGTSTVKFNGTAGSPTSWSSTSIAVPVPSGATTGNIVVTVSGLASNTMPFTVTGGLSGTVTRQSDGTAISGATVQVLQNGTVIATTSTAGNGTYSVSSLGTAEYDVKFSASGFGTVLQSAVTVPASGATLNQVLATPGTISGQVTQSNGVTAISGATVAIIQSSEVVATATSNGSGNYSVSSLSAGSYDVEVSAAGYVNKGQTSTSVSSGSTTTANFSLNAVGTQPVSYVYDQLGRLNAAIDQSGNVAVYSYDAVGNILSISRGSSQLLSVLSFSPGSGAVGNTVTVYGTAFSTTPSLNTVKFNGTTATVSAATVTSLVVTVPSGATTGTISVTTSAGTATSSANFTVTTSGAGQPTISSFSPSIGAPGTSVSVTGTNFETTSANDKLKFNIRQSFVSSATTTTLTTTVPTGATSGHLVVTTPSGSVSSTSDFFVPPGSFGTSDVGFNNRVSVGGNLTVTISTASKIGLVVFDGTAGHRLGLLTSSNSMTSSGGATTISINNPDGSSLVSQSVTTSAPFIAAQALPTSGTYTIVVQPSGGATGSITLALYDVPGDVSGSISVGGSSLTVTTTTPGQTGLLSFSGTSGQQVTVHATSNSIGSVTITLGSPNGETVTSQTSSSGSFNLSSVTLPGTGTCFIAVSPSQANTGSVTIQLTSP